MWLLILVEWFKKLLNTFILTLIENVRRSRKELIRTWEERAAVQGVQLHSKSFFNNVMVDAIDMVLQYGGVPLKMDYKK